MIIKHNSFNSLRISICLLGLVLLMGAQAMAQGYRHTISIDGNNDFNSGEIFETTSTGYSAFFSWDDDYLYVGALGNGIGNDLFYESYLVIYLDPDLMMASGAEMGRAYGSQQPAFLSDFRPRFLFSMLFVEPENPWLQEFNGEYWEAYPGNIIVQSVPGFFEAAIPLEEVGNPTTLGVTFSIVYTGTTFGESTHSGVPLDIFTNGYDPDFANHLPFDFSSPSSPNGTPLPTMVQVNPVPDEGSWELTGPDSFFATGSGDSIFYDVVVGDYSITWLDLEGWRPPPEEMQTLLPGSSLHFTGHYEAAPTISSIIDIPDDQGGSVRIIWNRVHHDDSDEPVVITDYEIYRRQSDPGSKLLGWDFVDSVPAHGEPWYQSVIPTLCDSTATSGQCWSVFMIRAATDDPYVYFESSPDSGYSVDNLAPSAPTSLMLEGDVLSWDEPADTDFDYFTAYGSDYEDFGAATLIDYAIAPTLDLNGSTWAYYFITATDFAGNESDAATWDAVSEVPNPTMTAFALHPNRPNPFNPRTTIAFELPEQGTVRLTVFDASGRVVNVLLDGDMAAQGRNEVVWRGRDMAGRVVSAGVYFYRLEAGSFNETKRMVLVK